MAAKRFKNQLVYLNGTAFYGKSVRQCSKSLFETITLVRAKSKTIGTAKIYGCEVGVERMRGRNGPWIVRGVGNPYVA